MAGEYVLELRDVSVRRGDREILGPITFAIRPHERWVVLGPNGAGKSTLLQILATRIFPTQGSAKLLDKEMGEVTSLNFAPESEFAELLSRKIFQAMRRFAMLYSPQPTQFSVAGTRHMIFGMNLERLLS